MPAPYGLTLTGFSRKTLREVLAELEAEERARISPRLNTEPEEPIGQLNGIFASKLAELWELAEAVNAGRFPATASGFQLDQVSSITGTQRGPATKGEVTLQLTAAGATTIPAGSIAQVVGDDSNRWVTLEDVVFVAAGTQSVLAEAETAGVFVANFDTIQTIVTPVSNWSDVTNPSPAIPGTEVDTDAQLRIRRENELQLAGSATVLAIRADLLQVEDVTSVTIFHNPSRFVDADGLPPNSVEALVVGGDDQDVRDALLATVAAGIETVGSSPGTALDSQGNVQPSNFSRPADLDMLVEIDLLIDIQTYPAGGDVLVQDAIASYINTLPVGNDVFRPQVAAQALAAAAGIINVTEVRIGSVSPAVSPVNADYTILARERAQMSAATNVTVATVAGSA